MEILKFGKTKMNELLKSGEFPAVKIGGQYRITKTALEQWMKQNEGKKIFSASSLPVSGYDILADDCAGRR